MQHRRTAKNRLRLKSPIHFFIIHSSLSDAKLVKNINFKHRAYEKSFFPLNNNVFARGTKSARGGPNPLGPGGPYPLADLVQGGLNPRGTKSAVIPDPNQSDGHGLDVSDLVSTSPSQLSCSRSSFSRSKGMYV